MLYMTQQTEQTRPRNRSQGAPKKRGGTCSCVVFVEQRTLVQTNIQDTNRLDPSREEGTSS